MNDYLITISFEIKAKNVDEAYEKAHSKQDIVNFSIDKF